MTQYNTDWNERIEDLVLDWNTDTMSPDKFLHKSNRIFNDYLHHQNEIKFNAMTQKEQNDYYRGYEKDEFLVGSHW